MTQTSTPLAVTSSYLVLIEREGDINWLGQFEALSEAQIAMTAWLKQANRSDEDAAFIVPIITWGRADPHIDAAHPGP